MSQHVVGKMSFAVPAPPPLADKARRLSDGEHFRQPNIAIGGLAAAGSSSIQKQLQEAQTQAQAQALADMILKVGGANFDLLTTREELRTTAVTERIAQGTTKMAVKRATSDPGQRVQLAFQTTSTVGAQQQQTGAQQSAMTEGFSMTGYSEDGGYFSPSLQDEVFQQVKSDPKFSLF